MSLVIGIIIGIFLGVIFEPWWMEMFNDIKTWVKMLRDKKDNK